MATASPPLDGIRKRSRDASAPDGGGGWTCATCTLVNEGPVRSCAACGQPGGIGAVAGWACVQCTYWNASTDVWCDICGAGQRGGNGCEGPQLSTAVNPDTASESAGGSSTTEAAAPESSIAADCSTHRDGSALGYVGRDAECMVRDLMSGRQPVAAAAHLETPAATIIKPAVVMKAHFDPVTKCWRRPEDIGTPLPTHAADGTTPGVDRLPKLGLRFAKRFKADGGAPGSQSAVVTERIDVQRMLSDLLLAADQPHRPAGGPLAVPGLAVDLKPYQQEGVAWLRQQEAGGRRGGILADDMGLGKTVQLIALLLLPPLENGRTAEVDESDGPYDVDADAEVAEDSDSPDLSTAAAPATPSPFRSSGHVVGTLVVCPASVLPQWEGELYSKVQRRQRLRVVRHHGATKFSGVEAVLDADVVLTTYATLQHEHAGSVSSSILFQTVWNRVVLDESQAIANSKAATARAVCALRAKYRWCLTGTPVQNSPDDLYATFKFLDVKPWAIRQYWVAQVVRPFTWKPSAQRERHVQRFAVVLRSLLLRRTKLTVAASQLPSLTVHCHEAEFSPEEQRVYDDLWKQAKRRVKRMQEDTGASIPEILRFLLRLRQACSHPALLPLEPDPSARRESCAACDGAVPEWLELTCSHRLCDGCFDALLACDAVNIACTVCSQPIDLDAARRHAPPAMAQPWLGRRSTKMRCMLSALAKVAQQSDPEVPNKVLIFTQWTTMLDLIEAEVAAVGHSFARLDGACTMKKRQQELDRFANDKCCNVLLMSLKAGGVGLNITAANVVFLMDLWWNPAVEDQAVARAHRTTQQRPVTVHRFLIKSSIEQRILKLHERKRACAATLLDGRTGAVITKEELLELFAGC
eukprot:GGOE01014520.1.p1 GENE.GGOE01014520.1~~GGOE01014520.1.p1  ORF type:complete len:892 (-),score=263.80 GGOE01014520.1:198-2798(-)